MRKSTALKFLLSAAGIAPAFPAGAQVPSPADTAAAALPDIIVTAERRSNNLQDLPLQVNVVPSEALEGLTQVQDLQNVVPGIQLQQSGPFTQFNVRGVGAVVTSAYNDSAVAFNVDDIYLARPSGMQGVFYDIERVEVLKGPQGTLYGRNASAGAINVITKQPQFDNSFGAYASYGNYDARIVNGFANSFFGSTAIRLAGQIARRDGYYSDGYDDEDTKAIRLQTLTRFNDDVSLSLGGDYAKQGGRGFGLAIYPYLGKDAWDVGQSAPQSQALINNIGNYGAFGHIKSVNKGLRAKLDWDIGNAQWTTIGAYRDSSVAGITYLGGIGVSTDTKSRQYSAETRLASKSSDSDRFSWLIGLYYFREKQRGFTTVDTGDVAIPSPPAFFPVPAGSLATPNNGFTSFINPITDESYAIYTQETFRLLPQLKLTGGLRYFVEKKTNSGSNTFYTSAFAPVPPLTIPATGRLKWDKVNFRVGLDYEISRRSMVYASVSNGWHAGGFLRGAEPGPVNPNTLANSYAPETLTAYTLGTKNRFMDNRVQANFEIFYWDYNNRQFTALAPINTGGPPGFPVIDSRTINVGKSHLQGASADLMFLATPSTRLSAAIEYIDEARNDRNVYDVATLTGVPIGCTTVATDPVYGRTTVDCSGSHIPYVSKWTATVGLNQRIDLGEKRAIVFDVFSKIASRSLVGVNGSPLQVQKAYTRTNMNLTYEQGSFSIGAFIKNLEGSAIKATVQPSVGLPTNFSPPFVAQLLPPRTYGVELSFQY